MLCLQTNILSCAILLISCEACLCLLIGYLANTGYNLAFDVHPAAELSNELLEVELVVHRVSCCCSGRCDAPSKLQPSKR